jgi:hypothetical protein
MLAPKNVIIEQCLYTVAANFFVMQLGITRPEVDQARLLHRADGGIIA